MAYLVFAYLDKDHDAYKLYFVEADNERVAIKLTKEADATAVGWEAKALTEDQAKPYDGFASGCAHSVGSGGETRFL